MKPLFLRAFFAFIFLFSVANVQADQVNGCFSIIQEQLSSSNQAAFIEQIEGQRSNNEGRELIFSRDLGVVATFNTDLIRAQLYQTGKIGNKNFSYYNASNHHQVPGITIPDFPFSEFQFYETYNNQTGDFLHCSGEYYTIEKEGKTFENVNTKNDTFSIRFSPETQNTQQKQINFEGRNYKIITNNYPYINYSGEIIYTVHETLVIPENNYKTYNPYSLIEEKIKGFKDYYTWQTKTLEHLKNPNKYNIVYEGTNKNTGESIIVKNLKQEYKDDILWQINTINDNFPQMYVNEFITSRILGKMLTEKQSASIHMADMARGQNSNNNNFFDWRVQNISANEIEGIEFVDVFTFPDQTEHYLNLTESINSQYYLLYATMNGLKNTTSSPQEYLSAVNDWINDPNAKIVKREDLGKNEIKDPSIPTDVPQNQSSPVLPIAVGIFVFLFILILFRKKKK